MKRRLPLMFLLALSLLSAAGCGQPRVAPHNLELTVKLRTAVSAQNEEWLALNSALVDERQAAGEMDQDEYDAFRKIIALAEAGHWEEAEIACVQLQKAQRPEAASRAQMERMQALSQP